MGERPLSELKPRATPEATLTAQRLRRFAATKAALISDLGGDPSQAQQIIARDAAALAIFVGEKVQDKLNGLDVDIGEMQTMMNTLRRQLESLGIERKARDITGNLDEYIKSRQVLSTTNGAGS